MRTLISNACVITGNAAGEIHPQGFLLLDGSRIAAVGPMSDAPPTEGVVTIDARGDFVTPGLINMHQHLHMNLMKGLADGMLLEPWATNFSAHCRRSMQPAFVRNSARLATLEMLRTGTTCVLNHQSPFPWPALHHDAAEVIAGAGMRQVMAVAFQCRTPKLPDHPWDEAEASLQLGRLIDELDGANGGLTRMAMAVECNAHHTEMGRSSDSLVHAGHALARAKDLRVAVHMSGGTLSMRMGFTKYRRQTGRSDVEYLESLGVLDHRWLLKHGIHFSDQDIDKVARRGASVVYTPTSESIRGGGLGPWRALQRAGITCALGSDGPAVDYSVDMVEQVKACCWLQAVRHGDADAVSPRQALAMATLDAARALGLEQDIGSLETGKRADLVVFDRSRPHMRLAGDPLNAFVRAARGADARLVLVDGRIVYRDGEFPLVPDAAEVVALAQDHAHELAQMADLGPLARVRWPVHA
jgi:5-methylthioadenosine/S-adenosylhomocysteine deaminase